MTEGNASVTWQDNIMTVSVDGEVVATERVEVQYGVTEVQQIERAARETLRRAGWEAGTFDSLATGSRLVRELAVTVTRGDE